ncbi:MAG: glycosyl transferase group 1, partial [Acidobacteriales bacterium]|nr:glycosyl transferase group 1 [Terriglobales bacterium]
MAWDAAKLLAKKGHEVALLCEGIEGKPESERVEGVWLVRYRIAKPNLNLLSRHQKAGEKTLRKVMREWIPELIWGHMPLQMIAMLNTFPTARAVYTLHSPVGEEFLGSSPAPGVLAKVKCYFANRIEQRCCESAEVITVLSRFSKSELLRLHGEKLESRIRITPGWTDVAKFSPVADRTAAKLRLGWPADRTVFFTLRRLVSRMGLDRLVAAAAIARDKGHKFQLYIGGTGPLRTELEQQIESLRLGDCVSLVGEVPEAELALKYASADAFVIPTRALECFGLIAVEAMAAGTPTLSTPIVALPEII